MAIMIKFIIALLVSVRLANATPRKAVSVFSPVDYTYLDRELCSYTLTATEYVGKSYKSRVCPLWTDTYKVSYRCRIPRCDLLMNYRTSYAGMEYQNINDRGIIPGCGRLCTTGDTLRHPPGPACRYRGKYNFKGLMPCDIPLYDGSMVKVKENDKEHLLPTFIINPGRRLDSFSGDYHGRMLFTIPDVLRSSSRKDFSFEFRLRHVIPFEIDKI